MEKVGYTKVLTIADMKKAIQDLPDEMEITLIESDGSPSQIFMYLSDKFGNNDEVIGEWVVIDLD